MSINQKLTFAGDGGMPGTDGGGGTLDGGCPGELIPGRKASTCCVLGDGGTTTTTKQIVSYH